MEDLLNHSQHQHAVRSVQIMFIDYKLIVKIVTSTKRKNMIGAMKYGTTISF